MASAPVPRFSADTLKFIDRASRQKKTDWLDRNRADYERHVLLPLQGFARTLKTRLAGEAAGYHFPQKGIGRLKRSANRALETGFPFKDWLSYAAARPRTSRFEHNPNLFFLLQPGEEDGDEILIAGGLYMPSSKQLRSIREAIAHDAAPFVRLFASKTFASRFPGGFSDERIATRPPRGFDPNHPRIEWLKLQAFFVWRSYSKREFASKGFAELVAADFAQVLRLNALLEQAIRGRFVSQEAAGAKKKARAIPLSARLEGLEAPRREMDF